MLERAAMMARRTFRLPGIQDLTKEQERALSLPIQGQHLIVGGPGTGKSVLTLLRARHLTMEKRDYQFLVYTHLLDRSNRQLFAGDLPSKTWMRWFREVFREVTSQAPPLLPAERPGGFADFDWQGIRRVIDTSEDLRAVEPRSVRPLLVIDEGQDMPPDFYGSLVRMGFENFFVAADQNQQITASHCSRQELEEALALDSDQVVELSRNYRNTHAIWMLAREFYTGDPASPLPDPPPSNAGTTPVLITYAPEQFGEVAHRIVQRARKRPNRLIGVLAPCNAVRERYWEAITDYAASAGPRQGDLQILTFHGKNRPEVHFDLGGILVINAQACKGLEFDEVVCADINAHRFNPEDPTATRKLFYVMVARARQEVFLLMQEEGSAAAIESILPHETAVLKRGRLSTEAR